MSILWWGLFSNKVWFGLVYGISTLVGYLMPNPICTYILNMYDWDIKYGII